MEPRARVEHLDLEVAAVAAAHDRAETRDTAAKGDRVLDAVRDDLAQAQRVQVKELRHVVGDLGPRLRAGAGDRGRGNPARARERVNPMAARSRVSRNVWGDN